MTQSHRIGRGWPRRFLAVLLPLLVSSFPQITTAAEMAPPAYIGSERCAVCHAPEYEAWTGSHHDLAWTLPVEGHVLGDFEDASFEHQGLTSRFTHEGERYFIETEGPDGKMTRYEVMGVAGIAPLQQYLVETEPGRLQALDLAWDAEQNRWYHLYPDQVLPPGNGLHWSGPYKNWNGRCAVCHATGYDKGYAPEEKRFHSSQAEIGVGCEACHGPGEAHAAWAEAPGDYDPATWPGLSPRGFTLAFDERGAEKEIEICAGCHSRREPLFASSPLPGTPFHDTYRLSLLTPGLYHPDGTIEDEVYVYGSFLQSRMAAAGVRCSDCHDPHRAATKLSGNAVCTACHNPDGNPRFPSAPVGLFDAPAHTFHEAGTPGSACVDCHMVERVYMGIDGRRDHSFRVPRPDLSLETGAPNACTDCHADKGAAWAAEQIAARFPNSRHRGPNFSQSFARGQLDPAAAAHDLLAIAEDAALAGIVRATALDLLTASGDPAYAQRALPLLQDPDPLVREAAAGLQRLQPPEERARLLLPALNDPRRAVRIAAARALIDSPAPADLEVADALAAAMREWRESLMARADFPETHAAIGGAWLAMRNPYAAEQAFLEAVRLDPQMVNVWSILVRLRAALGDRNGARALLRQALEANPGDLYLLSLKAQL